MNAPMNTQTTNVTRKAVTTGLDPSRIARTDSTDFRAQGSNKSLSHADSRDS